MKHVVVGDIHGCLSEFKELVALLELQAADHVICLGDFMDKGPDPAGCVKFARESGFHSVLGNHEERHIKWRRNEARAKANPKYVNQMVPFDAERAAQNAALSDEDVAWLKDLPVYLQFDNFVAVHGGLFPGIPLEDQDQEKIVRARYLNAEGKHMISDYTQPYPVPEGGILWSEVYDGPHHVVYGHQAHSLSTPRIDRRPNGSVCYGIDTGCVHGGRLTALVVEDGAVSFTQVTARRSYKEPPFPIPA